MILTKFLIVFLFSFTITLFGTILKYTDILSDFLYFYFPEATNQNVFDYIIVGSGSAGSIIANRIAADKTKTVLVLEAGKYDSDLLHIPSLGLLLQNTAFDWKYKTVPQNNSCLSLNNNVSIWPMGKILGGTSMLNNMLYVRGHRRDFDEWFKDYEGYDYSTILKYFKKVENYKSQDDNEHSIRISDLIFKTVLPEIFLEAAANLGYPVREQNLNSNIGYSMPKVTLYNGKRWTSADTLKLNKSPNLFIKTGHIVEKVLFKSNFEAYAVKYTNLGKKGIAKAKIAIILSAGVIGTPKILMLSGIGKKEHLKSLKLETKVDLPVGDNLQDHITTGLDLVLLNQTLDLNIKTMISPLSVWEYFFGGSGPWTTAGCELMAFFNTKNKSLTDRPNIQFMIMPLSIKEDDGIHLRNLMGISDHIWLNYFSTNQKTAITILPVVLHPKSRGTVRLSDGNPQSLPLIDPKYLSHPQDIDILIEGIELIKEIVRTPELKALGAEINPKIFPGCEEHVFDTKAYWQCYVRYLTITSYHPIGTCKMGWSENPSTVVDFNFQVKGTNKLFIADGSVLPSLPSGNVNGAISVFAEMASDAIKMFKFLSTKQCRNIEIFVSKIMC